MASPAFAHSMAQRSSPSIPLPPQARTAPGLSSTASARASAPKRDAQRVPGATLAKALIGCGLAACSLRQAKRTARRALDGEGARRPRGTARRADASKTAWVPTLIPLDDCEKLIAQSRPAHWVIRAGDLSATLDFLAEVFGMKVLRHEEFDTPCAISCNGLSQTPWSKTMVGYGREDENYCLELTYNYGVSAYEAGSALAHVAVGVESPEGTLAAAEKLGYGVDGDLITGPDGYKFRVVAQQPDRKERFQYVALRVADAPKAADFYEKALGMEELSGAFEAACAGLAAERTRVMGYSAEEVPLVLLEDGTAQDIQPGEWDGRNAIAIPGRALRAVYERVVKEGGHGGDMLHPIREFNEHPMLRRMRGLPPMPCDPSPAEALKALRENPDSAPATGTLTVAVVTDADGYEICLVSKETYDVAVAKAYDPKGDIDWEWRKDAMSGNRTPVPQHMLACV